jgi:hypothetical protein
MLWQQAIKQTETQRIVFKNHQLVPTCNTYCLDHKSTRSACSKQYTRCNAHTLLTVALAVALAETTYVWLSVHLCLHV